jgi:long-subunit fatty acid transport protein
MKKLVIVFMFFALSMTSYSQINELGVFAGGSNYIGDIGRTNYIYPNSYALGLIYKWNMHPQYSLRANYTYSPVKGDDADSDNSFRKVRGLSFSNDVHELSAGIEYHFFKYNLSKTGHTNTPYLFAELGAVNYGIFDPESGGSSRTTNFTMPFGAGFKTILAPGVGIGFEVGFRYTFKDDIDGYPYLDYQQGDNIQINPNNNDWYVFTGITLVFAFGREGCYTGSF